MNELYIPSDEEDSPVAMRRKCRVECVTVVRVHDHVRVEAGSTLGDWCADPRARVRSSSCHSRDVGRLVPETSNMYRAQITSLLVGKPFIPGSGSNSTCRC